VLKTKTIELFTMAITRRLAIYVIIVAVLAVTITLLLMAWVSSLTVPGMRLDDLDITDVQFSKDYLNITVKNLCTQAKIVSEVTLRDSKVYDLGFSVDWASPPHTVVVHEPIPVGEEISIRVGFKWTSGCAYQIQLKSADRDWETALNVVAP